MKTENLGFHVPDVYREAIREKRYSEYYLVRERNTWRGKTVTIIGTKQTRIRDLKTGRFLKNP